MLFIHLHFSIHQAILILFKKCLGLIRVDTSTYTKWNIFQN